MLSFTKSIETNQLFFKKLKIKESKNEQNGLIRMFKNDEKGMLYDITKTWKIRLYICGRPL